MNGTRHGIRLRPGEGFRGMRFGGLLALGLLGGTAASASDTLHIALGRYGYDTELRLLVVAMDGPQVAAQTNGAVGFLEADQTFRLLEPREQLVPGVRYEAFDTLGVPLEVYFTGLPLVQITSYQPIVDEPKVPGAFTMWSGDSLINGYNIEVEYRGGYSQNYPKRSLLIEFREELDPETTRNVELLGMRNDDDWNLQAMYVERLRLRNTTAHELWLDMQQPYYADLEPGAMSGVRHVYVELFLNGAFCGLYALGERVDRKQLQVRKTTSYLRGEIFKGVGFGVPTFTTPPPPYETDSRFWAGFKSIYPKDGTAWADLSAFASFVVESDDEEFNESIDWRFLRSNAIDYYLFMNVLNAVDNTGKNIFIARYKEYEPFFYVPWDLDAILGRSWEGSLTHPSGAGIRSNGLYDRWLQDTRPGSFRDDLCQRWDALRAGLLTVESIMDRFYAKHDSLLAMKVYEREALAWPGFLHDADELAYMSSWLEDRLAYLDDEFGDLCATVGLEEITQGPGFTVYPNPATTQVTVEVDPHRLPLQATLFNAMGQVVKHAPLSIQRSTLEVNDLPDGVYQLRLSGGNRIMMHSLVVVR